MGTRQRGRSNNGEKPNVNSNSSSASQDLEEPLATAACENCRTRKVRCDKKIPQCSNCEKAGVPCEFPNREKRVNHVNQLIEDVSSLGSRLDSIDATLSTLVQHMSSSQPASLPTTNKGLVPEISACVDTEDIDSIFYSGHFTGASGNNFVVAAPSYSGLGQDGSLNHIGARSLFENSRRMLVGLLERLKCSSSRDLDSLSKPKGEDNGVFTPTKACLIESELSAKYDQYPFVQYLDRLSVTSDGQSVALPPQSLLEMCLPVFFKYFNVTMPIFKESRLREASNSCYMNKAFRADEAYHLCFNNIIVLALGLQSRAARMDQNFLKGMSDELLPAFLNNSFRAFHHLSAFLQPRLICCQALATLAMVAREYHEGRVFDTICHLTSLAVKSIGLQQCNTVSNNSLSDTDKERQDLYWAVFVMDKQRTYISGRPFDLHLYDSDIQLFQTIATPALVQQCWKAHIHMMAIWEEIYIYLYSLRALRKGPAYRQNQISRLNTLSRRWYAGNAALLCSKPSPSEISADEGWQIELKYAFHLGQVLIHHFPSEESSQQVALTNSRAALRIIQSVFQSKHNKASISLLIRLFRHYPLVSIHALFSSFLANPTADLLEDLDLINTVAEALDTICDPNIPTSCLRTVNEGIQWYREVAMVFRTYYKGLKSQPLQTQPPKRPYEPFPAMSGDQGRNEPPENLLQKRRKIHPQSREDSNHLPQLDPSAHSWALLDAEAPVDFDNLLLEWMISNGPSVPRLPPAKDSSDCSSSLQPALRPEDEISRFLLDTLPPPSTVSSSCMPEPQRPFSPVVCGGTAVPTDLMPSAFGLFPYNSQVAEDEQDGGLFQLFAGQSDLGNPWGDIRDYTMPDEFFLHA